MWCLGSSRSCRYRFDRLSWLVRFRSFAGRTSRSWQSGRLRRSLLPPTPSPAAASAITVSPQLRVLVSTHRLRRRVGFVGGSNGLRWSFAVNVEIRLALGLDLLRGRIWKLGLQRSGVLLCWLFILRFAPLAAVTHPSAHVALVTRLPRREQLADDALAAQPIFIRL